MLGALEVGLKSIILQGLQMEKFEGVVSIIGSGHAIHEGEYLYSVLEIGNSKILNPVVTPLQDTYLRGALESRSHVEFSVSKVHYLYKIAIALVIFFVLDMTFIHSGYGGGVVLLLLVGSGMLLSPKVRYPRIKNLKVNGKAV